MDIKQWVEFLFRKIEQINNKDKISGITNWGIIGLLALIANKAYIIVSSTDYILVDKFHELILCLVIIGFSILVFYTIYSYIINPSNKKTPKNLVIPITAPYFIDQLIYITTLHCFLFIGMLECNVILHFSQVYKIASIVLFSIFVILLITALFAPIIIKHNIPFSALIAPIKKTKKEHMGIIKKISTVLFLEVPSFLFRPIYIYLFILIPYVYASLSINAISFAHSFKSFVLSCLIWAAILAIGFLIIKRKSYFLIDSLISLQDEIVTEEISDPKIIKEKYENIAIGQTLTQWFRDFWFAFIAKAKRLSERIIILEQHQIELNDIKTKGACESQEVCKPCMDKQKDMEREKCEIDSLVTELLNMAKRVNLIYQLYKHTDVAKEILDKQRAVLEEIKNARKIIQRLKLTDNSLERCRKIMDESKNKNGTFVGIVKTIGDTFRDPPHNKFQGE